MRTVSSTYKFYSDSISALHISLISQTIVWGTVWSWQCDARSWWICCDFCYIWGLEHWQPSSIHLQCLSYPIIRCFKDNYVIYLICATKQQQEARPQGHHDESSGNFTEKGTNEASACDKHRLLPMTPFPSSSKSRCAIWWCPKINRIAAVSHNHKANHKLSNKLLLSTPNNLQLSQYFDTSVLG
jgi:hypothetical protein